MANDTPGFAPRGTVVVLTADLVISAMVRGAAEQVKAACVTALDAESLLRRLEESNTPPLVVLHLETRGLEIGRLVERMKSLAKPPCGVIAFGPHVHEARLEAARQAGCDQVLSKGAFSARAAELILGCFRELP